MLALIGTYRELKGSVAETEAELQKNLDIMAEAASVEEAGAEAYRLMAEEGLSLSEAVDLVAGNLDKELVAQAAAAQAEEQAIVQAQAQAQAEEELSRRFRRSPTSSPSCRRGTPSSGPSWRTRASPRRRSPRPWTPRG